MPDLDDAALRELLDLGFDAFCQRPARDFIDPDRVLPALDIALTPERWTAWHARTLGPLRARMLDRAGRSAVTLAAWLPTDVRDTLVELMGRPVRIPRRSIDELVATEQMRDSVRAMLNDALTGFLKGSSEGAAGGLGAAVGWGARAMGAAGRGLLGGLGDGLQRHLQDRVREFVDGSVAMMQKRIAEKLASDETARLLGKKRKSAFVAFLEKTERDASKTLLRLPFPQIDTIVPRVVAHNLARAEVRDAIRDETRAVLEEISRGTMGELLDDAGLRQMAREALHAHGLPFARALVASDGFRAWWTKANATR